MIKIKEYKKKLEQREIMVEGLRKNFDLSTDEIMILEAMSYKLEEIMFATRKNGSLLKSEYVFKFGNKKVINMFKDRLGLSVIDPTLYYGVETLKQSKLIPLVKEVYKEHNYINVSSAVILSKIQGEVFKEYIEGLVYIEDKGHKVIAPYCNGVNYKDLKDGFFNIIDKFYTNSFEEYKSNPFFTSDLSNLDKKELLLFVLESTFLKKYKSTLDSFLLNNVYSEEEKLRTLILDFLMYKRSYYKTYKDYNMLTNNGCKLSFTDALYFLFKELYQTKYNIMKLNKDRVEEVFRAEILRNSEMKNLFFNTISTLMLKPNKNGYEEIIDSLR